jgi:hypothetical protein
MFNEIRDKAKNSKELRKIIQSYVWIEYFFYLFIFVY